MSDWRLTLNDRSGCGQARLGNAGDRSECSASCPRHAASRQQHHERQPRKSAKQAPHSVGTFLRPDCGGLRPHHGLSLRTRLSHPDVDWCVAQRQRSRRHDGGGRIGIALAGQNVEDDVGGVDVLRGCLGTGRLDRRQPVGDHGGEDVDHLPIAVAGAGELASDALHLPDRLPGQLRMVMRLGVGDAFYR
jgi:hypothetical protein